MSEDQEEARMKYGVTEFRKQHAGEDTSSQSFTDWFGASVQRKDGSSVPVESITGKGKVVGLYFSGCWYERCSTMAIQNAAWYDNCKEESDRRDNFEIVLVNIPKPDFPGWNPPEHYEEDTPEQFLEKVSWPRMEFSDGKRQGMLANKFDVTELPSLVWVNGENGDVIASDGIMKAWFCTPIDSILDEIS